MKVSFGIAVAVAFAVLLAAGPAAADIVIFSDNFNTENGGNDALNYNAFTNWNVTNGTVDLLGPGFGGICTTAGGSPVCVDLDGSTSDAGRMTTKSLFSFLAGQTYDLKLDLAGSQRGDTNIVEVEIIPLSLMSVTLLSSDPFSTRTITFTPVADVMSPIRIENLGGDNLGALLDNVVLSQRTVEVPEPAVGSLIATGLGGLLALRRRDLRVKSQNL